MTSFKKGAFASLLPIRPLVMKYKGWPFQPVSSVTGLTGTGTMILIGNLFNHAEMMELPPFIPNDYLFEKHKDKGTKKWEIYAWAVRDIMSKTSGIPKDDTFTNQMRVEYHKILSKPFKQHTVE
jgi:hypothetical protein